MARPVSSGASLVLERIQQLFEQASKSFATHPERSNKYVLTARRLSMKYRTPIPRSLKRRFCHHCYRYLQSGKNCTVRIRNKKL